jgi:hypothetical protein
MSDFSTLNESSLHRTLKLLYKEQFSGNTEVQLGNYIYDIVTSDNNVIEIQTKNLGALKNKVRSTLESGIKIKIVHPIVTKKTIYLYDSEHNLISKRVRPKKECIYSIFRELTALAPYLAHKNFSLEVLEIQMIEERIQTNTLVQSKNKKRRIKQNWLKCGKKLESLNSTTTFTSKEDYLNLLPLNLPQEFCAKDVSTLLKTQNLAPAPFCKNANLILWVLNKAQIIKETRLEKKTKFYTIN